MLEKISFRRYYLIPLAESIKTKESNGTFPKNNRFLLLCLSNQIYCYKNITLNWKMITWRNKLYYTYHFFKAFSQVLSSPSGTDSIYNASLERTVCFPSFWISKILSLAFSFKKSVLSTCGVSLNSLRLAPNAVAHNSNRNHNQKL